MRAEISFDPIDPAQLLSEVLAPSDGAVASFLGVVREVNAGHAVVRLEYSAYEEMATSELRRIVADAQARWGLDGVTAIHRIGLLNVGDISLAVVAAAPHRGPAFDGCRDIVERVKREVPIWKREYHHDGSEWVDAEAEVAAEHA